MRSDEEDACSLRGIEGDRDPEGSSQVFHAELSRKFFSIEQGLVLQTVPHVFEQIPLQAFHRAVRAGRG